MFVAFVIGSFALTQVTFVIGQQLLLPLARRNKIIGSSPPRNVHSIDARRPLVGRDNRGPKYYWITACDNSLHATGTFLALTRRKLAAANRAAPSVPVPLNTVDFFITPVAREPVGLSRSSIPWLSSILMERMIILF